MTIEIRALTQADHDAWLPLWRGYQAFYDVDIPTDVCAVTWRRLNDAGEPIAGALAWDEDTAVGLVHLILHRSAWTIGDYCYLQDLYVATDRRGSGIGRKLIEHTYVWAQARDCSRVYWLTHETNSAAMNLYDKMADRSGFLQYRKLFEPL